MPSIYVSPRNLTRIVDALKQCDFDTSNDVRDRDLYTGLRTKLQRMQTPPTGTKPRSQR